MIVYRENSGMLIHVSKLAFGIAIKTCTCGVVHFLFHDIHLMHCNCTIRYIM